jgi:hypothetical protein
VNAPLANVRPIEISAREISEMLGQRIVGLCDALALTGHEINGALVPLNPTRHDRKAGSFVINLQGNKQGKWEDYAVGHYGDALDLVAYVSFGGWPITREGKAEALRWGKRWLGIGDSGRIGPNDSARMQKAREAMDEARSKAEGLALATQDRNRRGAQAMFLEAAPLEPGTPGWVYLTEGRGVNLGLFREIHGRLPWAVRSHHAMRHVETDQVVPCLISAFLQPDGTIVGVHRVFLEKSGLSKLKVEGPHIPTKKIWPRGWHGGIIPISRGRTQLAPRHAHKAGLKDECAYWEGVENAFSAALLCPEWRVSAVGSAGNFASIEPPECASVVIAGRDNDRDRKTRAAVTAKVEKLREKCEARGVAFLETWPRRAFKDINDEMRGIRC